MGRSYYTENDFDRMLLVPLCLGITLIGIGAWYPSANIALLGLALTAFGAALLWLTKS